MNGLDETHKHLTSVIEAMGKALAEEKAKERYGDEYYRMQTAMTHMKQAANCVKVIQLISEILQVNNYLGGWGL